MSAKREYFSSIFLNRQVGNQGQWEWMNKDSRTGWLTITPVGGRFRRRSSQSANQGWVLWARAGRWATAGWDNGSGTQQPAVTGAILDEIVVSRTWRHLSSVKPEGDTGDTRLRDSGKHSDQVRTEVFDFYQSCLTLRQKKSSAVYISYAESLEAAVRCTALTRAGNAHLLLGGKGEHAQQSKTNSYDTTLTIEEYWTKRHFQTIKKNFGHYSIIQICSEKMLFGCNISEEILLKPE